MPINSEHPMYNSSTAKFVRDFNGGELTVKDNAKNYVSKLSGHDQKQFEDYVGRGSLIPAVKMAKVAVQGAIMRKPPTMDAVDSLDYLNHDVDGNQTKLNVFVSSLIGELLLAGGFGCLVEWEDKAVIKIYKRESVVNVGNSVVLSQNYYEQIDEYESEIKEELLELLLIDGAYTQRVWRKNKKDWYVHEVVTPTNRGEPLGSIPFIYSNVDGLGFADTDPILLDLTSLSLAQFRLSVDLRHGLHWTALPTWFAFGNFKDAEGNDKQISVGSGDFNVSGDTDARVELIEFSGAGLGAIDTEMKGVISAMASAGAKLLSSDSGGVKAAETARIDASSETATLSTVANTIDTSMSALLEIIADWSGVETPEFAVNRDFIDIKIDPQTLTAWLQVYLSGSISLETFLYQIEKGEGLQKGETAQDEVDRLEQ